MEETRVRLEEMVREEVSVLGGEKVFLGGLSQGCTAALDVYLRLAPLNLGGFVGSVGFLPSDAMGFKGADEAMERLLGDEARHWCSLTRYM